MAYNLTVSGCVLRNLPGFCRFCGVLPLGCPVAFCRDGYFTGFLNFFKFFKISLSLCDGIAGALFRQRERVRERD